MDRVWLDSYPKEIPHDVNIDQYSSLINFITDNLKKYKDKPAYTCLIGSNQKTLTYGDVDRMSKAMAGYLQSLGLKKGDRVAIMLPNIVQYPVALFGVMRAGLIAVNTNPLYTCREIKHQFNDSGVKAVIIAENFAHELEKVVKETGVEHIVTASIGGMFGGLKGFIINTVLKFKGMVKKFNLPGAVKFPAALKAGTGKPVTPHQSEKEDMVCIQYTGGTTGVAKGAVLTNKNLLSNMEQMSAWMANANIKVGQEVMLTPLPMYHIFSFTVNCLCMSNFGALNVLVPNPRDIPGLVDVISKTKPSLMTGVNTLYNALLNNADFRALDFSQLKFAIGGAMAIQGPVAKRWKEVTANELVEGYGMTETSPVVSANPFGSVQIGTIGLPFPSTYMRIMDEDGKVQGPGEGRGEIQIKGPQVMKGYYNRPEATANSFTEDGWLKTGDVGVMLEGGFFKIVDRIKDMILVSGFNVYPNEIEDVLASHPKVLEVAAIGVPDPKSTEAVKVFIVKKDASLTEQEVREFCVENFTGYKKPKHVEFRDELPKTNVGKILRRALRDEIKKA
ncbi:AMP-binding protein [Aureispira anguillae]|uniref:Long-chain-fatty-acid--CoA ligase n=2 Tax=Aureispira anguillae TaxID=2864201 RepID=A0A915YER0_9BACT|nr:AMP-binding protein [Aureispira anguillae]